MLRSATLTIPWDFTGYHLPHLTVMREALERGAFPFWDSYNYCGRPFAANPQTQALYPFRWLSVVLASGQGQLGSNLEIEYVLHIVLAGFCTVLLVMELGLGAMPAALAAVAYMGGCFFTSQAQHVGAVEGGAWLPAIWWAIARLVKRPSLRTAFVAGTLLAAAFLTGFLPGILIIYESALLLFMMLCWVWSAPVLPAAVWFGASMGISALLASVQLIPAMELAFLSVGKYRLDWRGTGGGIPYEALPTLVWPDYLHASNLAQFRLPYDPTTCFLFSGFVPLLLLVIGFRLYRDRLFLVCAGMAGFALLLMLGDKTALGSLAWNVLPAPVRGSYYSSYWIMPFSLALSLAAAVSLQRFSWRWATQALALVLTTVELLAINSGLPLNLGPNGPQDRISRGIYLGDKATPGLLLGPTSPAPRFDIVDANPSWVFGAALLGIPTANGYDPLALERMIQARLFFAKGFRWGAFYKVEQPGSVMLEAMNVDNLLSQSPLSLSQLTLDGWVLKPSQSGNLYTRNARSKRAYFVPDVRVARDMQHSVDLLKTGKWDPKQVAIVETESETPPQGTGEVHVASWLPGSIALRTSAETSGFLFVSEAFYPGWKAVVDGQPHEVKPANVAFQGFAVPSGTHDILLHYSPRIFWLGSAVSLLGLCVPLLCLRKGRKVKGG